VSEQYIDFTAIAPGMQLPRHEFSCGSQSYIFSVCSFVIVIFILLG